MSYYLPFSVDLTEYYNNGELIASASDFGLEIHFNNENVMFIGCSYDVYRFAKIYDFDPLTIVNMETNEILNPAELNGLSLMFEEDQ